jgi:hypothetical protein
MKEEKNLQITIMERGNTSEFTKSVLSRTQKWNVTNRRNKEAQEYRK